MILIRRSCQSALRGPNNVSRCSNASRRAFSESCVRTRGALPVFLEPSSPELSALLSKFNSKILLPYHLTKEQEKLVFRHENKAKLEAEPVEISLGDVTLPLEHINQMQLPNHWSHFKEIISKSKTKEDWENLVRILEGFENAGIPVKPRRQELVVRQLNRHGMQHLVLKALQRPKATGLRLSDWGVLIQVVRGVHDKAALADWEKEETSKAFRMAKQVVDLMEDEEHCGGQTKGPEGAQKDWRGKPVVVALPTELAAIMAERHGGDVDKLKKLANRLINALKQDNYMKELDTTAKHATQTTADFGTVGKQLIFVSRYCHDLFQLTIVWNALKTSRKVLGADMPMAEEAQQFETRVEEVLMLGFEAVDKLKLREGQDLSPKFVEYIREGIEKCR
ncbi:hypothetical protein EJ02DRAFT_396449, partial [Clathrospora elynae]